MAPNFHTISGNEYGGVSSDSMRVGFAGFVQVYWHKKLWAWVDRHPRKTELVDFLETRAILRCRFDGQEFFSDLTLEDLDMLGLISDTDVKCAGLQRDFELQRRSL